MHCAPSWFHLEDFNCWLYKISKNKFW